MSELAFHETDDIIQELLDRFDHAVFAGVHVGIEGGATDQYFRRYRGSYAYAHWLCGLLLKLVGDDFHEAVTDSQHDEEE